MRTGRLAIYRRSIGAAALLALLGASVAWTSTVSAQLLPPLPGALIVTITSPTSGSTVSGTTTVRASVSVAGSLTVAGVQFKLDGADLGAEDRSAPYSVAWDTRTATNGSHTLTAVARDVLGLRFTSDPVTVTVFNDTTPPTVSITSPAPGETVAGTITLRAGASDNVGVVGVQFFVDGAARGAEDTTAPYSVPWDTTAAPNGAHTISARARDVAGNSALSGPVTVTVQNAPPPDMTPPSVSITSPPSGGTVSGAITVSASASDNVGVVGVQFFLDGTALGSEDPTTPYSVAWDTSTAANGSHTLSARARDAAGNIATSSSVTVTVSNAPPSDTTPPSVSVTSPASGATVSGTISVSASASDNVGVAGVQFLLDGAALGTEDTAAPYSTAWDTTGTTNGSHTLSARARDAAGNTTVSAPATVTVSNAAPPPPGTVTRVQETDASVSFSGAWTQGDATFAWSGGTAAYSRGPGAQASITFTGTRIAWIGWREPRGGRARVILDGALAAEVDLYASSPAIQEAVFTSAALAEGTHTLVVEAIGTANPAASDTIVVVDAFDVTSSSASPPPPGTVRRFEETDSSITYVSSWIAGDTTYAWSGGTATYTVAAGAQAIFPFTGTRVDWIGYRGRFGGIVRVFLDGAQVAELDTYSATEEPSVVVYRSPTLASGSHTLTVELTDRSNPAAANSETAVDAFDVAN